MSMLNRKKLYQALILPLFILTAAACSTLTTPAPVETPTNTPFTDPTVIPSTEVLPPTTLPTETPPKPTAENATVFPDPAGYGWSEVISDLNRPIGLTSAWDNSGRLFIIEQRGRILIYDNGELLNDPFLDIQGRVGSKNQSKVCSDLLSIPILKIMAFSLLTTPITMGIQ